MKVLVSGSTGLVGSALIPALEEEGHEVIRLVRSPLSNGHPTVRWDGEAGAPTPGGMEGIEAVVHLAGESIAEGRWTGEKKERIRLSRVRGTRLLAGALSEMRTPPKVLISASAIGFYGDRGSEILNEDSPAGEGFLADVCREWENAVRPAEIRGVRVVRLRIGVVLTPEGGALARMLAPFRLGVGGRLGDGHQYMSWISLEDLIGTILYALEEESLRGAVNAVAPGPVTNAEFTRELGKALSRPAFLPVPALAARAAFGEMAKALLLSSTRVEPSRLLGSGYRFRHPEIGPALREMLALSGH